MMTAKQLKKIGINTRVKEINGFKIGQNIRSTISQIEGKILGFDVWGTNESVSVFIDAPGNHGTYHVCGIRWIEQ